jgi:hypothetical protein
MNIEAECREFAALLQSMKNRYPEMYRHIIGLIKTLLKK